MKSDLHIGDLTQQIIMYQIFNTGNLSKKSEGEPLIISQSAWTSQTLPESMDPSKALSETDITDKVHDLSNLPLPNVQIDISNEERRVAVVKYLLECFGRIHTERNMNQKVDRTLTFVILPKSTS